MTKARASMLAGVLLLVALAGCRSAQTTSAILYIDEQRYDKAVKVLHEALEYNPEEADAFFYLGEAHSKLAEQAIADNDYAEAKKNYELAYRYYTRARELKPQQFGENVELSLLHNYTLRSNDGKNEFSAGYYEAAEGFFRLAYAALPDSTAPLRNIARMKIKHAAESANDPALLNEALELLDQVLAARPEVYELQADKANVLSRLGRSAEANAIYERLLAEHPDDTGLLIDIANLAVQDRDLERAADLYVRLAHLLETDGKPENDDQIKDLLVQAADWYGDESLARYEDAIDLYKRALQLELVPEEATMLGRLAAHYRLGDSLRNQAQAEADPVRRADLEAKAASQFRDGVDVGNALVSSYFTSQLGYYFLSRCQEKLGDIRAAEANFAQYIKLREETNP